MPDEMIADLKKEEDDEPSEKSSNMKRIGEPGVEIAMLKNDHRGDKERAEDHRGADHDQADPRLEDGRVG